MFSFWIPLNIEIYQIQSQLITENWHKSCQRSGEVTSSVPFEVLIIICEIDFIKLFIFNRLTSNINLLIFNSLTSNINYKFVQLQLFDIKFYFPKNISFANRKKQLFMDARPEFRVLNSSGKMMTWYLRDANTFFWGTAPFARVF